MGWGCNIRGKEAVEVMDQAVKGHDGSYFPILQLLCPCFVLEGSRGFTPVTLWSRRLSQG